VLVRTEALAVDQVDTLVRSGAYRTPTPFPFIIGRDLAGRVAASGPGAADFAEGDRVWCNSLGHGGRQGSFAQHVVVAAETALPPSRRHRSDPGRGGSAHRRQIDEFRRRYEGPVSRSRPASSLLADTRSA
jgi:Alcohol dehydrogenase GroES-like domain